jgi:hypothetical protein
MEFAKIYLVVTDEQQKFGVHQRAQLRQKSSCIMSDASCEEKRNTHDAIRNTNLRVSQRAVYPKRYNMEKNSLHLLHSGR